MIEVLIWCHIFTWVLMAASAVVAIRQIRLNMRHHKYTADMVLKLVDARIEDLKEKQAYESSRVTMPREL